MVFRKEAVEVLNKLGAIPSKGAMLVLRPAKDFGGGYIAEVRDARFDHELYGRFGATGVAALAALVQAEGKEKE